MLGLAVGLSLAWADVARAAPPEVVDAAPEPSASELESELAPAEPEPQTAIEWYARGYELGTAGDYAAAAEAFLRSYDLQPTSEALFNAAFAFEQAGATVTAIETYERFLAEPARAEALVDPAQRSIVALTLEVAVLEGVRFDASRPPAQLLVRGQLVDLDAFPILVMPGELELEVVDERGVHARETYQVAAGETLVVDLRALLPAPREPGPKPIVDSGPTREQIEAGQARARLALALRNTAWVGVGLSGAGAISLLSVGLLAQREQRRFRTDSCYDFVNDVCPPDFEIGDPNAHRRAYTRYIWGVRVIGGVTAGLALTTLVIGLVSARHSRQARKLRQARVAPGLGSLTLRF